MATGKKNEPKKIGQTGGKKKAGAHMSTPRPLVTALPSWSLPNWSSATAATYLGWSQRSPKVDQGPSTAQQDAALPAAQIHATVSAALSGLNFSNARILSSIATSALGLVSKQDWGSLHARPMDIEAAMDSRLQVALARQKSGSPRMALARPVQTRSVGAGSCGQGGSVRQQDRIGRHVRHQHGRARRRWTRRACAGAGRTAQAESLFRHPAGHIDQRGGLVAARFGREPMAPGIWSRPRILSNIVLAASAHARGHSAQTDR